MNPIRTIPFDPAQGYPAGRRIRYECLICGVMVRSMPERAETCRCDNVAVDANAGRVTVQVPGQMRAVEVDENLR